MNLVLRPSVVEPFFRLERTFGSPEIVGSGEGSPSPILSRGISSSTRYVPRVFYGVSFVFRALTIIDVDPFSMESLRAALMRFPLSPPIVDPYRLVPTPLFFQDLYLSIFVLFDLYFLRRLSAGKYAPQDLKLMKIPT